MKRIFIIITLLFATFPPLVTTTGCTTDLSAIPTDGLTNRMGSSSDGPGSGNWDPEVDSYEDCLQLHADLQGLVDRMHDLQDMLQNLGCQDRTDMSAEESEDCDEAERQIMLASRNAKQDYDTGRDVYEKDCLGSYSDLPPTPEL